MSADQAGWFWLGDHVVLHYSILPNTVADIVCEHEFILKTQHQCAALCHSYQQLCQCPYYCTIFSSIAVFLEFAVVDITDID